ncbi:MAG TPA: DivIVA domain-containing protein [Acidimicrobiales bacterium]|jgi:DivIVA domain-containing protein|nr:DivIVA domain-containing protein [Acidimicrobiales bacterium]
MPPDSEDARSTRLGPDAVARTTFPTSFRGYDPDQVRQFLERVANELREFGDREAALRVGLEAAEARAEAAAHLDEAQLTAALGEETARVLLAAREAATEIRAKGEDSVARLLREAQDDAARMKAEADTVLGRATTEAEEAAKLVRAAAEQDAARSLAGAEAAAAEARESGDAAISAAHREVERILNEVASEAEEAIEAAKAQGREMVEEALLVRTRVLEDLSRKRKAARVQLERLQAGRERLLESYDIVRRTLDEATAELRGSLTAAKRSADAAARRTEIEPPDSVEQLEAEVEAARDAGLPIVDEHVRSPEAEPAPEIIVVETVAVAEPEPEPEPDAEPAVTIVREPDPDPEPEPEPAPEVIVEHEVVALGEVDDDEVVVVVDEVSDEDAEATQVDVDGLFARIREARAAEVARAHEVLAATPPPADAPPGATETAETTDEIAVAEAAAPIEDEEYAPASVAPDDQALLERRDAVTDAAEQKAVRKLKRVLADEQNEVLDRLRRNTRAKIGDLLPPPAEHARRYSSAAAVALAEVASAGAEFYGSPEAIASIDDLATDLGVALALPLRDRLTDSLREAAGDDDALADGVRAAYRDWKTHRIGMQTRDMIFAAFNRGLFEATSSGQQLRWLVDDGGSPCPDAEDNSLAGLVTRGEPYPTGDCYPPAHPGCRCLLVPAPH